MSGVEEFFTNGKGHHGIWNAARVAELLGEPAKEVAVEMKRLLKANVIKQVRTQFFDGPYYRRKWQ